MNCLAICQPYAFLLCLPESDPRKRHTEYRTSADPWDHCVGQRVGIYAAATHDPIAVQAQEELLTPAERAAMPLSMLVGTAYLAAVAEIKEFMRAGRWLNDPYYALRPLLDQEPFCPHDWIRGKYQLVFTDIKPLSKPVAWRGAPGWFQVADSVLDFDPGF